MIRSRTIKEIRDLNTTHNTEYYAYRQNLRSEHLIVYFGSHEGKFAGMTNVESLDCNGFFVRCDRAKWYVQKYKEHSGPKEFSQFINNFIKSKRHIKTITLAGFSMGAYGALLFGTWIECDKIVATAPQTKFPDYLINKEMPIRENGFEDHLFNIVDVWGKYGKPNCEIIIQSCKDNAENETFKDYDELMNVCNVYKDVKKILLPCAGHKGITPVLLTRKEEYERLFLTK